MKLILPSTAVLATLLAFSAFSQLCEGKSSDSPTIGKAAEKDSISTTWLRGNQNEASLQELNDSASEKDGLSLLSNFEKPIGEMTMAERSDTVAALDHFLQGALERLPKLDSSEWEDLDRVTVDTFQSIIEEVRNLGTQLAGTTSDARKLIASADDWTNSKASNGGTDNLVAHVHGSHDRRQTRTKQEEKGGTDDFFYESAGETDDSNYGGRSKNGWQRRASFANGDGKPNSSFQGHGAGFHANLDKLAQSILDGDHRHVKSFLHTLNQKHQERFKSQDNEASGRRLSKSEMCTQLAECAGRMSKYDLFVYYKSDDIDPSTGEVDDNSSPFDEQDLSTKYKTIQYLADKVKLGEGDSVSEVCPDDSTCDCLLQNFHRTIEYEDIPQWEGATVSQVCLAEGTTVYAELGSAAVAAYNPAGLDVVLGNMATRTLKEVESRDWQTAYQGGTSILSLGAGEDGSVYAVNRNFQLIQRIASTSLFESDRWEVLPDAPPLKAVDVGNRDFVFGVTLVGKAVRLTDRLTGNMEVIDELQNFDFKQVSVATDGTVLFIKTSGNLVAFDATTNTVLDGLQTVTRSFCSIANASFWWCMKPNDNLWQSTNGGASWESMPGGNMEKVSLASDTSIWVVQNDFDYYEWDPVQERWYKGPEHRDFVSIGSKGNIWSSYGKTIYEYIGVATLFDATAAAFDSLVETFIHEPIMCAEEMYLASERADSPQHAEEEFVFGIDGKPTYGSLYNVRIPTGIDKDSDSRTEHGQIKDNKQQAFTWTTFKDLRAEYVKCTSKFSHGEFYASMRDTYHSDSLTDEEAEAFLREKVSEFVTNVTESCVPTFFEAFDIGFGLVFGEQPSPGFVCGVKEAIVEDGKTLPGSCCLDAPFQLAGDDWGHPYDCSMECQSPAPYFAGMSVSACDAYGGTWCPAPTDCSELQACISESVAWGENNNSPAYMEYVANAPNITNSSDYNQCGKTREYFGFDENFVNDEQVCEDIKQLRFTRDFNFLDEFFNQGSEAVNNGEDPTDIDDLEIPPLVLTEPDTSSSSQAPVQNGKAWRSTNFALRNAAEIVVFAEDFLQGFECFCSFACVTENTCAALKNVVGKNLGNIAFAMEKITAISEFTYGEKAESDNIGPIEVYEQVMVLFGNMELTGSYLQQRFMEVQSQFLNVGKMLEEIQERLLLDSVRKLESLPAPPSNEGFDVQIEIVARDPVTLLCLSKLNGVSVDLDDVELVVWDVIQESFMSVEGVDKKKVDNGVILLKIPKDIKGKTFKLKVLKEGMALENLLSTI